MTLDLTLDTDPMTRISGRKYFCVRKPNDTLFDRVLVLKKMNKLDLRSNFPGNLAVIYLKFDSSAPYA